ncbi:hypothetical protein Sjap_012166 [Stephania japonica]|uniref:Uncharacterized protein n=1 Tax=Stephania japonica TaxID=461633 RepID=A0AAP0IVJ8_9MAGN
MAETTPAASWCTNAHGATHDVSTRGENLGNVGRRFGEAVKEDDLGGIAMTTKTSWRRHARMTTTAWSQRL